ncbi:MAG: hypothetical protein KUG79_17790 [Pseudomonadales bacterium]|nr:hypothetical protein [Pseudomonadales bacterium]
MQPQILKQTLNKGGRVYGCMLSAMASTRYARALTGSSLDFAVIDAEHGSRDRAEIEQLCTMLKQCDITPVVRIPVPRPEWVSMALDAGATGILAPYCETEQEVSDVVGTAKWHPLKGAYLQRAIKENIFPSDASRHYLENIHRDTLVIIGIESVPAYENLDRLLSIGQIDGIFIGPNDLSTSMGIPDDYTNQQYIQIVGDIIHRCEAKKIPVMVHQQSIETSTMAINLGARFILHAQDTNILQRALQSELNQLRQLSGDPAIDNATDIKAV